MANNIKIGNTYILTITVKNEDGTIKDLTTVDKVLYRIAKTVSATQFFLDKNLTSPDITIPNPSDGKVVIKLQSSETKLFPAGNARQEAVIGDSTGNVFTILSEDILIEDQLIKGY